MNLSIIIPAYITSKKGADDLHALIRKIYAQLDPDFNELLVVNDGSTVEVDWEELIGVSYHHLDGNHGVAYARNYGIDESAGKWINFIDADDDVPVNFVSILTDRICFWNLLPCPPDIIQFQAKHQDGNIAFPEPCAWGKLIRREWIGDDRFDPDQLVGEEDTLFLKPGKEKRLIYDDGIIYHHRQDANPDSLMKRYWRGEVPQRRKNETQK